MIVGITGHQDLGTSAETSWVESAINTLLDRHNVSVGVTSLAIGADQLFASALRFRGIPFKVIVPSDGYESTFESGASLQHYRSLLSHAETVHTLDYPQPSEEAFFAAGKHVVDESELLFAIWNGKPAAGLGGTADVVKYALDSGISVIHINPSQAVVKTLN